MTVGSKEFLEIMKSFEMTAKKTIKLGHSGLKREHRDNWKNGFFYTDGRANDAFKIFQSGYSCGRNTYLNEENKH